MFSLGLPLEEGDIKELSFLAKQRGMSNEEFARMVFLKGLRPLLKNGLQTKLLESRIKEHWKTHTDYEIGQLMDPPVRATKVKRARMRLRLIHSHPKPTIDEKVNWSDFDDKVIHGGYSLERYIDKYDLGCTRERLRLAAEERGIRFPSHDHNSEWLAARRALFPRTPAVGSSHVAA